MASTSPSHAQASNALAFTRLCGGTRRAHAGPGVASSRLEQLLAGNALIAKGADLHGCGPTVVVGLLCTSARMGYARLGALRIGENNGARLGKAMDEELHTAPCSVAFLCLNIPILA